MPTLPCGEFYSNFRIYENSTILLAKKHQPEIQSKFALCISLEVCPLSSGANSEPLSTSLQCSIRFIRLLIPAHIRHALRLALPRLTSCAAWQHTRFTLLSINELTRDLGFLTLHIAVQRTLSSGGIYVRVCFSANKSQPYHLTFCPEPIISLFWLNSFYEGFSTSSIN